MPRRVSAIRGNSVVIKPERCVVFAFKKIGGVYLSIFCLSFREIWVLILREIATSDLTMTVTDFPNLVVNFLAKLLSPTTTTNLVFFAVLIFSD